MRKKNDGLEQIRNNSFKYELIDKSKSQNPKSRTNTNDKNTKYKNRECLAENL